MPQYQKFTKQLPVMMTEEEHAFVTAEGLERRISANEVIRRLIDHAMGTKGLLDKLAR